MPLAITTPVASSSSQMPSITKMANGTVAPASRPIAKATPGWTNGPTANPATTPATRPRAQVIGSLRPVTNQV